MRMKIKGVALTLDFSCASHLRPEVFKTHLLSSNLNVRPSKIKGWSQCAWKRSAPPQRGGAHSKPSGQLSQRVQQELFCSSNVDSCYICLQLSCPKLQGIFQNWILKKERKKNANIHSWAWGLTHSLKSADLHRSDVTSGNRIQCNTRGVNRTVLGDLAPLR